MKFENLKSVFHSIYPVYPIKEVLEYLRGKGAIDTHGEEKVINFLETNPQVISKMSFPWYINLIVVIGAWVAAGFFISALSIARFIVWDSSESMLPWGGVLIIAAVLLYYYLSRKQKARKEAYGIQQVFLSQIALVFSVAGHFLVLFGVARPYHSITSSVLVVFLTSGVLCILLYPLVRNFLHRFLSCLLFGVMAFTWILEHKYTHHWIHLLIFVYLSVLFITLGYFSPWKPRKKNVQPITYAVILTLLILLLIVQFPDAVIHTIWYPSNIIMALVLIALSLRIARENHIKLSLKGPVVVGLLGIVCLIVLSTPGLIASVILSVFAFHERNNILKAAGLLFFILFIYMFYYNMNIALDIKSGIMAGTGLVLIGFRQYLKRCYFEVEDTAPHIEQ